MRVLVEAVGSPAWGTLFPHLRAVAEHTVGLDIDPLSFGLYLLDRGYLVPPYSDPGCFDAILRIAEREAIDLVLPSINEGLLAWAQRREDLAARGVTVLLSPPETIALCVDKWETHRFLTELGVPTPATSLAAEHALLKPRRGRGGTGIRRLSPGEDVDMTDHITQEFIEGQELSVDALCDLEGRALCVVPRVRIAVESGLSVKGQVIQDREIEGLTRRILEAAPFVGPVNVQCFRRGREVLFTEINPRIAGGMSLSFAATENWFEIVARLLRGEAITPRPVRHGLTMMRFYSDCIVPQSDLLR